MGLGRITDLMRRMILMLKCDKCGRFIAKSDAHVKEISYYLSTDQEVLCGRCAKTDFCKGYWSRTVDGNEFDCEYNTSIDCGECMFGEHGGKKDPRSQKYAL